MSEDIEADSHQEYLLALLSEEVKRREETKKARLVKSSGFYTLKSFDDFRFDEVTLPDSVTPSYLKDLSFMDTNTNLVMYGNVGTGYDKYLVM